MQVPAMSRDRNRLARYHVSYADARSRRTARSIWLAPRMPYVGVDDPSATKLRKPGRHALLIGCARPWNASRLIAAE